MKRVLIIEDNPWYIDIDVLQEAFPDILFEVVLMGFLLDGKEERADLILLDHRLPGKNGDELAREFRARGIRTPILGIGSLREPGYPQDVLWVSKKLSVRRVREMIRHAKGEISLDELKKILWEM